MFGRGSSRAPRCLLSSGARVAASLALVVGFAYVIAPERAAGSPYLFWSNGSGSSGPTIGRAQLGGSGVDHAFVSGLGGTVGSVAGGPNYAYWGTFPPYSAGATRIGRVDLNGLFADPAWKSFGSSSQDRGEVALYDGMLFWLNSVSRRVGAVTLETGGHDGAIVGDTCPDGPSNDPSACPAPAGLAVDASGIYWANHGKIFRASLSGAREPGAWAETDAAQIGGLALDAEGLYFSDPGSGAIGRIDKVSREADPSWVSPLPDGSRPRGLAVYGPSLYWADEGTDAIGVAPLTGGEPTNASLITGASDARGVGISWPAPEASVSPTGIDFEPLEFGEGPGEPRSIVVENVGFDDLSVGSPSVQGPGAGHFELDASDCEGSSLAPAGSCLLTVSFEPAGPGRHRGELVIPNDGVYGPKKVALSGVGAPVVRIASAPPAVVRARVPRKARASFRLSVDPSTASLECRLGTKAWRPCSRSPSFTGLRVGKHLFSVRASLDGAVGAVVSRSWALVKKKRKRR